MSAPQGFTQQRRDICIKHLQETARMLEPRERYACIIGSLQALLDHDPDLVEAIDKAFRGQKEGDQT